VLSWLTRQEATLGSFVAQAKEELERMRYLLTLRQTSDASTPRSTWRVAEWLTLVLPHVSDAERVQYTQLLEQQGYDRPSMLKLVALEDLEGVPRAHARAIVEASKSL
jgi:hypothetical protein